MSLQKNHTRKIKTYMLSYATKRRELIKQADDALHFSKRAIFSLHRDDSKEAKVKFGQAEKILKSLQKTFVKTPALAREGAYKAALEEYVEARLFEQFLAGKTIGPIKGLKIPPESFIAGLCDVPGELLRYGIQAATNKDEKTVKRCAETAQEVVGELIEFNLTKYLRNKFDQAKNATQKLENVVYELSLRG